jgi:protein-disulfide isomerase
MGCRGTLVLIAVVSAAVRGGLASAQPVFEQDTRYRVPVAESPQRGPANAPITIVEFSDFLCRACQHASRVLQEVQALYPGLIRVVYKHQLVIDPEGRSRVAARAAATAAQQGQFWALHDALFAHASRLDRDAIDSMARAVGLDMASYSRTLSGAAAELDEVLGADLRLARALGVSGTPQFFVNGRPINGAMPIDHFVRVIEEELDRVQVVLGLGIAPRDVYEHLQAGAAPRADGDPELRRQGGLDPLATYPVSIGAPGTGRAGPAHAPVTMVVFADVQCPYCARHARTVAALRTEFGRDLRVVFRHLPLPSHPRAALAAEAVLAAGAQGRFWEMHDTLFANQRALDRADLMGYAQIIGLDAIQFGRALDQGTYRSTVEDDREEARRLGVRSTPTTFINGSAVVGALPIEAYRAAIHARIAEARELIRRGVKPGEVYARAVGLAAADQPAPPQPIDNLLSGLAACREGSPRRAQAALARSTVARRTAMIRAACQRVGVVVP